MTDDSVEHFQRLLRECRADVNECRERGMEKWLTACILRMYALEKIIRAKRGVVYFDAMERRHRETLG